jgi:hypothetical protein
VRVSFLVAGFISCSPIGLDMLFINGIGISLYHYKSTYFYCEKFVFSDLLEILPFSYTLLFYFLLFTYENLTFLSF